MNIFKEIISGNKYALSKGITLLESSLEKDKIKAKKLINKCLSLKEKKTIRIGVTGVPGVGKSTFINTFGQYLIEKGKKVAVLAIDPSSEESKGSILGDKTRMYELSKNKNSFIRPSPNNGKLGGLSPMTRENILLCESAGYDIVLIETVGVGQNETHIKHIIDVSILLMIPGAGDEIQGIKRGIMELADIIVVNKADGNNLVSAKKALQQYKNTSLLINNQNKWKVKTFLCSSTQNTGFNDIYKSLIDYIKYTTQNNLFNLKRINQNIFWLHYEIRSEFGNKKFNELKENKNLYKLEEKIKTSRYKRINMAEIL
ncbi:MAG: methylmalonyl Co-A mutase-associated GTPase MeaB [Flavobacteriales bacterium]|nr:methylmalonyl Co-A mutase-associated GTPase MeaB [Flavobacteriales bacterium]|tara:strand:- start:4525 stop:5469 length:945 start_codon:yes stop_codon:yes gene_type:complete